MRRIFPIALIAALATACSSSDATTPTPTVARESAPAAAASPPSPTPTPAEARVGATQESVDEETALKITVFRFRQPLPSVVPGLPERKGYEYAAAEVRGCISKNTGKPISLSWYPWSLAYEDGTIVEELGGWSAEWWAVPLYPNASDRPVKTGRCVRGWIPFEVPKGSKPKYLSYDPSDTNSLEWTVR